MEEIRDWERKELEEMAYKHLLSLGWDAKTARHMARIRAPLVPPPNTKAAPTQSSGKPNRKPWQDVRKVNEYKMREAILKVVERHGWTSVGIRKLAELAEMKHRTARTVLDRMAEDGQVVLDASKTLGPKTGVYVVREHPCWSDQKHAHLLALSNLSSQVKG